MTVRAPITEAQRQRHCFAQRRLYAERRAARLTPAMREVMDWIARMKRPQDRSQSHAA